MALKNAAELQPFILHRVGRTRNILGRGSFGVVEELMFDRAPYAGKIFHDTLLNLQNVGIKQLIKKFERVCKIMKEIHHPNIVQFFGLCFFEYCLTPVIVMELLIHNVEQWLSSKKEISLSLKSSILRDIAKGLHYLHSNNPKIIHRNLTARNVLLTKSMSAKITDFGNSYIVPSYHLLKAMKEVPEIYPYMPPEAFQSAKPNSEKLDMFSFGHLALYIMIEEKPYHQLLPPTIPDRRRPNKVIGLSEIERREKYLKKLHCTFNSGHNIPSLIHQCLQNDPEARPITAIVIKTFDDMLKDHCDEYEDLARYETVEKFREVSDYRKLDSYGTAKKVLETKERILKGQKFFLKMYIKRTGIFRKETKKWKDYIFCHKSRQFQYFENPKRPPLQVIDSATVESVEIVEGNPFIFQVNFKGNCQWILKAEYEDDGLGWVEAIKELIARQAAPPKLAPPLPNLQTERDVDYNYEQIDNFRRKFDYEEINISSLDAATSYDEPQAKPEKQSAKKKENSEALQRAYTVNSRIELKHGLKEQPRKLAMAPPSFPVLGATLPPPPSTTMDERVDYREHDQKRNLKIGGKSDTRQHSEKQLLTQYSAEQLDLLLGVIQGAKAEEMQRSPAKLQTPRNVIDGHETGHTYEDITNMSSHLYYNTPNEFGMPHFYYNIDKKPPLPPKPGARPRWQEGAHCSETARPSFVEGYSPLDLILKKSSEVSTDLLVLHDDGEDDENSYEQVTTEHRPDWAKARMTVADFDKYGIENDMLSVLALDPTQLHNHEAFASGQFGHVYRAILDVSETESIQVAIKAVKHENPQERQSFIREMCVMSKMLHPNIIRLHGLVLKENLIVLEYMDNGDLGTFLKKNKRPVPKLIKYMMDIGLGMHHISSLGLVHRDLAARNVLVSRNETCKIADFGMLRQLEGDCYEMSSTSKVPVRWCAPEFLKTKKFYPASDVWGYGIVLREMAYPSDVPYKEYLDYEVAARIMDGWKMEVPCFYPDTVQKIMTACWNFKPEKRPSFQYITMLLTKQTFNT